ncbi:hypothetical protein QL285_096493 [Trifolium repens]|nr:hypothetical protein QL285_096493 [Trifolium repens]
MVLRHGRVVLMPYADDFQPQKHASLAITNTIQANYHEPFRSYKTPVTAESIKSSDPTKLLCQLIFNEMDAFEAAFDTKQNTLPPSERADEVTRSGIMVNQFIEVAGGMSRNRLRGQGNTSSLVIRTPMGYIFDGSNSFGSVGSCSSATLSYSAADYQDMERRLKADNDARLQSRLDEMRLQLREEARQDMELMVQRMMSQRDQGYQPQQPQQHPQHIPARHSTYASSHPHQQQPRPSPQMPSRHSIHETSQLQPILPQTSSYHEVNVNLISDQDMLEQFLGPNNHAGNQGDNQDRSGGRGTGGSGNGGNENSNDPYYGN